MRIEKSILIDTTPNKVWEVFTNPLLTQKMGGSYQTDWQPGSFFWLAKCYRGPDHLWQAA